MFVHDACFHAQLSWCTWQLLGSQILFGTQVIFMQWTLVKASRVWKFKFLTTSYDFSIIIVRLAVVSDCLNFGYCATCIYDTCVCFNVFVCVFLYWWASEIKCCTGDDIVSKFEFCFWANIVKHHTNVVLWWLSSPYPKLPCAKLFSLCFEMLTTREREQKNTDSRISLSAVSY